MPRTLLRTLFMASMLPAALGLASCSPKEDTLTMVHIFIPDTESMNADRFGDETFPVFMRPAPTPLAMQPMGSVGTRMTSTGYPSAPLPLNQDEKTLKHYGTVMDDGRMVPPIPIEQVDSRLLRQEVPYDTDESRGTIVVDTQARYLYLVLGNGRAMRYGVGIGREGHAWSGRGTIRYKEKWPRWTPTGEMVKNDSDLRQISAARGGLVGGVNNPLGARALYIYTGGKDSLYRVHGTPDWQSIGKETSSGCIRMFNQDVIDLYNRARSGATIVVR